MSSTDTEKTAIITWTESTPDYNMCLNWLAQCKRRLYYPLDTSERSGLSAFEYAWKAVNNLYAPFPGRPDKKKMYACLDAYLNKRNFLETNRSRMITLCNDVSSGRFAIYDVAARDLFPKACIHSDELKRAVSSNDENLGAEALVDLLDVFRNARIHGQWGTGRTYFARLPRITYELCIHLLSGKTQNDIDAIIALVETRKKHLIDEIKSNISGF